MKKKAMFFVVLLLVGLLAINGCNSSSGSNEVNGDEGDQTEAIKITFADYGSSEMAPAYAYRYATEYINENSNGRIEVEYVPDAVLGNETEMIQQLMDGTLQLANLGTSTFSKYTDKLEAFQLPFLVSDYETQKIAFESPEGKALLDSVEELGVKIVGYGENGMRHFANNVRPINTVEDLKGLKLRIVPTTILQEAMELLGANPSPLNYGEVYTALQNKVIDGEEINITSLYAMKHYETIKYVSEIGMYPFPCLPVFNLEFWNSLSKEDQEIIEEGFKQGKENLFNEYLPEYEEEARKGCEDAGLEFNEVENLEPFIQAVKPLYDEYKEKDPKIKAFIEMIENSKK